MRADSQPLNHPVNRRKTAFLSCQQPKDSFETVVIGASNDVQMINTAMHPDIGDIANGSAYPHHSILAIINAPFLINTVPTIDSGDYTTLSLENMHGVFVRSADKQIRRAIDSAEFDNVFIGHSQGANIVMHMLNHACTDGGIQWGSDGH